MSDFLGQFDAELQLIYVEYVRAREGQREPGEAVHPALEHGEALFLLVQYTGDLSELESLGLASAADYGPGLVGGTVRLEDLEALAKHPNVVQLEYGSEDDPLLETSVPEVKADQVWTLNRTTGVFSAGETGKNVIIGIIDSGIDINHSDFLKKIAHKETRIKRIWDPGLDPVGAEHSPVLARLAPATAATYGVEYTEADINTHLGGGATIRHKDCNGHGTHVASIAAGDGRAESPRRNVGVAPEADLVIVKIFSLEKDSPPSFNQRFLDAVHYIQNVARHDLGDRSFVINYSGGSSTGPHDGLTAREIFLTNHFRGLEGKAFVTSCGNTGNKRRHALIKIPPAGTVDVPFELWDRRVIKTDLKRCSAKDNTRNLSVDIWYPDINTVKVRLKLPTEAAFRPEVSRGSDLVDVPFDGGKKFSLFHQRRSAARPAEPPDLPTPAIPAVTVHRSNIALLVKPHGDNHATGDYVLKIIGPPGTELHAWCSRAPSRHGFKLGAALPAPPAVEIKDEDNLIGGPAGARHIISVAAYDDVTGTLATFSSRGFLVDYAGVGNFPEKPDLAGPGFRVDAAESDFSLDPILWGMFGPGYTGRSGTSMAAPHVSGATALMLQKKNDIDLKDIIKILRTVGEGARAAAPPKAFGAGKLDVEGAVDNVS